MKSLNEIKLRELVVSVSEIKLGTKQRSDSHKEIIAGYNTI